MTFILFFKGAPARKPLAAAREKVYSTRANLRQPVQHSGAGKDPDMKAKLILSAALTVLLSLVALAGWSAPPSSVEQVPRLTKDAVKEMLGKPDVVIVDVRYIKQYEQSDKKIPGAVFVQPENFDEFVRKYPQKDATYILY